MHRRSDELVVASFNLHAGVNGWGHPYDPVPACAGMDADVLVLQEDWIPPGGPGLAERVARALGYSLHRRTLASGRRAAAHAQPGPGWGRAWRSPYRILFLDSEVPLPPAVVASGQFAAATPGEWGLALLTRRPVTSSEVLDLGRTGGDRVHRAALAVRLDLPGGPLTVAGTHMPHPSLRSPSTFGVLRRRLREVAGGGPAVLAGDMNVWGPAVSAWLPGWRRVVHGRTWPAERPHSQIDHILVTAGAQARSAGVLPPAGSDHRPVRARIAIAPAAPSAMVAGRGPTVST